jgi:UPF0716 family protein affecting phage T7 exclusion
VGGQEAMLRIAMPGSTGAGTRVGWMISVALKGARLLWQAGHGNFALLNRWARLGSSPASAGIDFVIALSYEAGIRKYW